MILKMHSSVLLTALQWDFLLHTVISQLSLVLISVSFWLICIEERVIRSWILGVINCCVSDTWHLFFKHSSVHLHRGKGDVRVCGRKAVVPIEAATPEAALIIPTISQWWQKPWLQLSMISLIGRNSSKICSFSSRCCFPQTLAKGEE